MESKIAHWLTYQPRTRLVFMQKRQPSFRYVDFGYEFSKAIEPVIDSPALPMKAEQIARNIIKANRNVNETFGKYVALDNLAILLEPELKIDFKNFLTSISQNSTIILLIDDFIKGNRLHNIDLSNLEYYQPD